MQATKRATSICPPRRRLVEKTVKIFNDVRGRGVVFRVEWSSHNSVHVPGAGYDPGSYYNGIAIRETNGVLDSVNFTVSADGSTIRMFSTARLVLKVP